MTSTIALLMFAVIIGFIVYLFWRSNKIRDELGNFYRENNHHARNDSPVKDPFVYNEVNLVCTDAMLAHNTPYTLILGSRVQHGGQGATLYTYIGIFLPAQMKVSDEWLNAWKAKVAERGDNWAQHSGIESVEKSWGLMGPPDELPLRAVRVNDGVFLGWSGLHIRNVIEKRLDEVRKSLNV